MKKLSLAATTSLILCFTGCGLAGSQSLDDTETGNVYALLWVVSHGDGTSEVNAQLKPNLVSPTNYALGAGDALEATVDGVATPMVAAHTTLRGLIYQASFDSDAEDTQVEIALTRTSGDPAPGSVVTLPAPFSILSPSEAVSFSRTDDDITVTWSDSGTADKMSWRVVADGGSCLGGDSGTLTGDPGTLTLPAGSLVVMEGDEASDCAGRIELTRTRDGDLDGAFSGGSFVAEQTRTIHFMSVP